MQQYDLREISILVTALKLSLNINKHWSSKAYCDALYTLAYELSMAILQISEQPNLSKYCFCRIVYNTNNLDQVSYMMLL